MRFKIVQYRTRGIKGVLKGSQHQITPAKQSYSIFFARLMTIVISTDQLLDFKLPCLRLTQKRDSLVLLLMLFLSCNYASTWCSFLNGTSKFINQKRFKIVLRMKNNLLRVTSVTWLCIIYMNYTNKNKWIPRNQRKNVLFLNKSLFGLA